MATTTDAREIAGTLYQALIGTAVDQLKAAAPKLAAVSGSGADVQQRVLAALPADALPQVKNFVLGLAKEGLLNQISAVTDALSSFATASGERILDAEVTSAVVLSDAQRTRIIEDLRTRYGAVSVSFNVDETLIGGLIIRVGDQVLDNSLRSRLGAVQRNMMSS